MSKKILAILCSLLLIVASMPFVAMAAEEAGGGSPTVIYDMQADTGISGAVEGAAFTGTSYLQNSGGTPTIVTQAGGKSIYVSGRTGDYNGVDTKLKSLGLTAGTEYTFTVNGHVDNDVTVPGNSQIVLSNPNGFGSYSNYQWLVTKAMTAGHFTLEYKKTFTNDDIAAIADNSYFRVQTSAEGSNVPFYVDNIIITKAPSAPSLSAIYDMQEDPGISGAADGSSFDYTDYLQNSGGTRSIVTYNGGKSIYVSARTGDYQGVDIKLKALGLTAGVEYTFSVSGHVDGSVSVPSGSQIVFSNPNGFGSYTNYQWLKNKNLTTGDFTIEHKVTFTADDITALGQAANPFFRIQTSGDSSAYVPIYVDNIIITKAASMEIDPIAITFNDEDKALYEDNFTANASSSVDWVNEPGIGTDDDYALRGTHTGGDYNSGNNAIRLTLPNPLPIGGIYSVSASFYVPAAGNEGKGTLTGPGIVLNNDYGGATGVSKFPSSPGTIGVDQWQQLDITLPARTSPLTSIDFRFVVNEAMNHPDVWYIDDIEITLVGQQPVEVPEWDLTLDSLYEAYANDFLMGNAISTSQIANAEFANMVKLHYNVITAENAMKPAELSKSAGTYNYTDADTLVNWALGNGIAVHGHTLIWHSQSADWLNKGAGGAPLTRSEAKANLISYINNVAGHYKGKVISWDVVNEAFADGGSFDGDWKKNLRQGGASGSPWYMAYANGADLAAGESGADYIYDAFVQTRLVDPEATLYYNDYNENEPTKREAIAAMVEDLNAKWAADVRNTEPGRLLIEGIGMQSHFNTASLNIETVENAIKRFAATGAILTVSELDIPAGASGRTTPLAAEEKVLQAQLYAQLFQLYKQYANDIERVTIWGAADPLSWRSWGHPLLFDKLYAAKESYYAVIDPEGYLAENPLPVPQEIPEANAVAGTPVIDGEEDDVWATAPVILANTKPNGQTEQAAIAEVRTLWDHDYLYVYADVADSELNNTSSNPWEQDSVEVFLSETMHRGAEYTSGDGQYRVTYEGNESFKSSGMGEGFESSAKVVDGGYIVELMIPFRVIEPAAGAVVGFDVQINDASSGSPRRLTVWSDLKANGYNTTENWGELTLTEVQNPDPIVTVNNDTITVEHNGNPSVTISSSDLQQAIQQANDKTVQIVVDSPNAMGKIGLPAELVKAAASKVNTITIENELMTVTLEPGLLKNMQVPASGILELDVAPTDPSVLPEAVRNQAAGHPVYAFNLSLNGTLIEKLNGNDVKMAIRYTLKPGDNRNSIDVYLINDNGNVLVVNNGKYDSTTGMVEFKLKPFGK